MALQEAASAGMKSMEHLIRTVSQKNLHQHLQQQMQKQFMNQEIDCREMADFTVSKFRKVISILNRTGHARFRRAPVQPLSSLPVQNYQPQNLVLKFSPVSAAPAPPLTLGFNAEKSVNEGFGLSAAVSTSGNSSSTFVSSITGEGSVSNGKGGSSAMFLTPAGLAVSAGKSPLSEKRCREHDNVSGKTSSSNRCHCKKRKSKVKRTIRVPAISAKVADIPADEYSWRKYGQKPIKGSPYPRGYYRCSTVRGCPAKKHVERANDDPTMLVVTYGGEHRHTHDSPAAVTVGGI